MTMDIESSQQIDIKMTPSRLKSFEDAEISQGVNISTKTPAKRSFDVAFLMLPDDKMKRKLENSALGEENLNFPLTELSVRSDLINRYSNMNRAMSNTKVLCDNDYTVSMKVNREQCLNNSRYLNCVVSSEKSDESTESEAPRSAFSKVSHMMAVSSRQDSPVPPVSPDQLSCSSSTSPPISYSPPSASFRPNYNSFINASAFQSLDQTGFPLPEKYKHFMYRANSNNNFNNNEQSSMHSFKFGSSDQRHSVFMSQPDQFIRNPAAAILSSLMPTTLGALSLPAQNVCAKCNISFRMTSDLVYHMRSHHKNENNQDPNRRKREEKLKCPVCSESFRERHHLTRHMTAHQDKEGDLLDHEIADYHSRRKH